MQTLGPIAGELNGLLTVAYRQGRQLRFATRQANGGWQAEVADSLITSVGRDIDYVVFNGEPFVAHRIGTRSSSTESKTEWCLASYRDDKCRDVDRLSTNDDRRSVGD